MDKQIYKIENYESNILFDLTEREEGYDPKNLSPQSNKYIWITCRYCGKPNRTKKAKYTNSGNSNAHMECRKKELKETDSTWARKDIKEKIKNSLIEKYGVDHSSKIEGVIDKRKKTWEKNYGVDNPSKAKSIKDKKKETCLKNHGVEYPLQNKKIFEKSKQTVMKRFHVERPAQSELIKQKMELCFLQNYKCKNPMQNEIVKNKMKKTFKQTVCDNKEKYKLINILRDKNHEFWEDLANMTINDVSKKYGFLSGTLRGTLVSDEFIDLYKNTYSFPKNQTQNLIAEEIRNVCQSPVMEGVWRVINPYELDIYIPDLKFAIEFNGNLWHSEKFNDSSKARKKHRDKLNLCREKGIYLFQIFEHQWESRQKQILNFIKTVLGANKIKIPGRKCLITHCNASEFIEENHIQGQKRSSLKYFNLEYKGEIVASMTASRHHRQNGKENSVVLSRLCFKDGINVQGGSSKLFKAFVKWAKEEKYSEIISWSDNCWTEGNIYKVLGFDLDSESDPDYFYWDVKKHKYHSKQSQKKSTVACPNGMTEREWAIERDLYRIWDCGKKRWKFELNPQGEIDSGHYSHGPVISKSLKIPERDIRIVISERMDDKTLIVLSDEFDGNHETFQRIDYNFIKGE